MARWMVVASVVSGVTLGGALVAAASWEAAPPEAADFVVQTFDDLDPGARWVTLKGTAHYEAMVMQKRPGSLIHPARTEYVFAFFPENDTSGKQIPVIVRTQRAPDPLVGFETMVVHGELTPATIDKVPPQTEIMISKRSGHFFDDDILLLQAVRIDDEDGAWQEPE